jgi:hypothetical protein
VPSRAFSSHGPDPIGPGSVRSGTGALVPPLDSTLVSTQMSPGTETIEDRRTLPTDDGDHERFSHYVEKDKLTEAMVMGTPVVALCGKVWVPSRDPEKYPVCPECKDAWEQMKKDDDE